MFWVHIDRHPELTIEYCKCFSSGDLSYATGYLGKWETFMNAIGPVSRRVPYMVGQGNHEQDWYLLLPLPNINDEVNLSGSCRKLTSI